jgi:hypothetical protein
MGVVGEHDHPRRAKALRSSVDCGEDSKAGASLEFQIDDDQIGADLRKEDQSGRFTVGRPRRSRACLYRRGLRIEDPQDRGIFYQHHTKWQVSAGIHGHFFLNLGFRAVDFPHPQNRHFPDYQSGSTRPGTSGGERLNCRRQALTRSRFDPAAQAPCQSGRRGNVQACSGEDECGKGSPAREAGCPFRGSRSRRMFSGPRRAPGVHIHRMRTRLRGRSCVAGQSCSPGSPCPHAQTQDSKRASQSTAARWR